MSLLIKALQKTDRRKNTIASDESGVSIEADAEPALKSPPNILDDGLYSLDAKSGFADNASRTLQRRFPQVPANSLRTGKGFAVGYGYDNRAAWAAVSGLMALLLAGGVFYYSLNLPQQPTTVIARRVPTEFPQLPMGGGAAGNAQAQMETKLALEPLSQALHAVAETDAALETPPRARTTPESQQDGSTRITAPVPGQASTRVILDKEERILIRSAQSRAVAFDNNAAAVSAYQVFIAGDTAAAGRLYRHALQSDPRNVDILLGLAAVVMRQGDAEGAEQYYRQVLDIEPSNTIAQVGLIGLTEQTDPVESESRLKSLLAQQPDNALLHAALGNLYAEQGIWPVAQQSYFQAFHIEPANAEYAFNLAVSLDQLGKMDLALNYYRRAQELEASYGEILDKMQLEKRINQLRQALGK